MHSDFNGDGRSDVVVGVPGYDSRARTVLDELAVDGVERAAAESAATDRPVCLTP